MPKREKIIERLRDMSNICANRGEIQSMRTLDCAIALLTEQDERGLFEDCEDCQEYVSEEHYCPWFCDVIRKTVDDLNANAQKWIPVTERLPEEKISPMTMDYMEYPCVFDGRDGQREVRYYKFGKGHFWHGPGCIDEYVTHWAEPMPLPEPPKGEDHD